MYSTISTGRMLLIHSYPLRYVTINPPLAHFFSVAGFTHGKYINIACDFYFDGASCRLPTVAPTMLALAPQMRRAFFFSSMSAPVFVAIHTAPHDKSMRYFLAGFAAHLAFFSITPSGSILACTSPVQNATIAHGFRCAIFSRPLFATLAHRSRLVL